MADKRGGGEAPASLDEADEYRTSLGDVVAGREDTERAARWTIALDQALARLTAQQREIVDGFARGYGMSEMARVTGRARSTLYLELRRIQEVFEDVGLDEFL